MIRLHLVYARCHFWGHSLGFQVRLGISEGSLRTKLQARQRLTQAWVWAAE